MYNLEPQKKIINDILELYEMDDDITLIDVIVEYAEINNIDIEYIASIILKNQVLCADLQIEAEKLNFLPKTNRLFS